MNPTSTKEVIHLWRREFAASIDEHLISSKADGDFDTLWIWSYLMVPFAVLIGSIGYWIHYADSFVDLVRFTIAIYLLFAIAPYWIIVACSAICLPWALFTWRCGSSWLSIAFSALRTTPIFILTILVIISPLILVGSIHPAAIPLTMGSE